MTIHWKLDNDQALLYFGAVCLFGFPQFVINFFENLSILDLASSGAKGLIILRWMRRELKCSSSFDQDGTKFTGTAIEQIAKYQNVGLQTKIK